MDNVKELLSMKEVIDVFTNPNIIDLEQLFVYYKYDKETNECASVPTDIKDIEQLNVWIEKSNHSKFYKNAINVWTKRDVLKRNTAKQNKLNFLEIFSTDITEVIKQIKERII